MQQQTTTPAAPAPAYDMISFIIAFEDGNLDREQVIEGFQHLIDSGTAWTLQGFYGRTARSLIESGDCTNDRR